MPQNKHSIIIVDDSLDDRELLKRDVKKIVGEDRPIHLFDSGRAFLNHMKKMDNSDVSDKTFENKLPEMVFLDLMMPEMDGLQTLKELRGNPLWADIPVTLITNSRDDHQIEEAQTLGANAFLPKPFDKIEVMRALQRSDNYSAVAI